jgi:hypothetical protein
MGSLRQRDDRAVPAGSAYGTEVEVQTRIGSVSLGRIVFRVPA